MNQIIKEIAADAQLQHVSAQCIADCTGMDRKTIAAVLSGETENPKIETLQAIVSCLHGEITYSTPDSRAAIRSGDISYYRTMLANLRETISEKNAWLLRLFLVACALIASNILTALICFTIIAAK